MESLTQRWTQSGLFFLKSGHFFRFSKRVGEASPVPSSYTPVSVAEYASEYPRICLNILENA